MDKKNSLVLEELSRCKNISTMETPRENIPTVVVNQLQL